MHSPTLNLARILKSKNACGGASGAPWRTLFFSYQEASSSRTPFMVLWASAGLSLGETGGFVPPFFPFGGFPPKSL